ncbi:MAG: 16S rRNA (cytosine(1402)-N(4))-methyltransferase, partial [Paludibacteraceae bacterium]|nr:16S rRNA (cytosine(1402)-N(4))-methyltransferase [Paludibacteraceae bacterium]
MDTVYHIPAMLKETIEGLDIKPDGIYVDVTFGGGGHSRAILDRMDDMYNVRCTMYKGQGTIDKGHLYSFDQDKDALQNAIEDARWTFVHSNFRYLRNWMDFYGVEQIDGLLADLGVSFHHFDCPERGFSFR